MSNLSEVKILFVDDEVNILNTLRRLMSLEDFDCYFANSGKEGIALLEKDTFDIIVSDMRMPEMNGDEFLTLAKEINPQSTRFILSGYADFNSMMNALNKGGVQQFIAKPWDDELLVAKLTEAAQFTVIRKERDQLIKLTQKQAAELKEANQLLEARVEARTQEVKQTSDMLDLSYQELKSSYSIFIDVIAQVLQLRSVAPKDHLNDIAETARALAKALGENNQTLDDVYKAAKLHELGKIGIPESVLKKPLGQLQGAELTEYKQYPMQGYSLMASLDNLGEVANLIRAHCERFDGKGFPSKLKGNNIPIGARIVAISMNYFLFRNGLLDGRSHTKEESEGYIKAIAGRVVDPQLIDVFIQVVNNQLERKGKHEVRVQVLNLKTGMVLSRDLFNLRGVIMLTKGAVLTEKIITKLKFIAEKEASQYVLYIEALPDEE